jgi:hypothetical protein
MVLGLRRFFQADTVSQSLGDLSANVDSTDLPNPPPMGILRTLLLQCEQMGQLLNTAMPLESIVDVLAGRLNVSPVPPPTDEGFEAILDELSARLKQKEDLRRKFLRYTETVHSLLSGIGKSLPHTLDHLVEELKRPQYAAI